MDAVVEREHDDGARGHAAHLAEAGRGVRPVVDGEQGPSPRRRRRPRTEAGWRRPGRRSGSPAGRWSIIRWDGSTATTVRSVGSYEPAPAPTLSTRAASPARRGSAARSVDRAAGRVRSRRRSSRRSGLLSPAHATHACDSQFSMSYEFDQIPYPLVYEEQAAFKDTYGGAEGVVVCESYLLEPKTSPTRCWCSCTRSAAARTCRWCVNSRASGHHVIYCNSRYRSDVALIMEKVVLDLGACVRDAKERLGTQRSCSPGGVAAVRCRSTTRSKPRSLGSPRPRRATRPT